MKFRSGIERQVAELLRRYDIPFEYESLKVPYVIEHIYNPDFILGNSVVLEVKGYWDASDRRKIKAVVEQNPELDLRMVFQQPGKTISKKSKTTYAMWCERHGIKWCSYSKIPTDWLTNNTDE